MVESNQTGGLWPQLYTPFRHLGSRIAEWLSPASDASSDDDAYRISVELPGVSESDIALTTEGGVLTVSGEKTATREDKGASLAIPRINLVALTHFRMFCKRLRANLRC